MQKRFYIFISILFLVVGFFLINQNISKYNLRDIKEVKIAGQNIKVELVLTKEEKEQGLSGRQGLNNNEGMLFVFEHSGNHPFWMKDMNFPIDIIWLAPFEGEDGENLKVVYIKKNARPESYPETYGPDEDVSTLVEIKYVLEVVSGFSEKNDLKEGDKV
ncbi:DUF192 domain-containing protein, partial [Candidatus Nomurabacteria bacterium]|nr:DUF192 domain-containing protein [Candidatus Nomurabacteria bacterium]